MIDLYFWPTPNGYKPLIFLEEVGLAYTLKAVDIGRGDQFDPAFLKIAPNNRMPAIVDHDAEEGALSLFESGAILEYLGDKTGRFLPRRGHARYEVLQWLYWQMGGLGPMAGQNHHFSQYAPEKIPYAIQRYQDETHRLYGVLDGQLADRAYVAGDYSIADMASWPWIRSHERQGIDLAEFPNVERWFDAIAARPAVQRAYAAGEPMRTRETVNDDSRSILFGQRARRRS